MVIIDGITVVGSHTSSFVMKCNRLPTVGEYIIANEFFKSLDGGKGSNQALSLSRLGAKVNFVSVIGDDEEGESFVDYFKKHGVNLDCVSVIKGELTAKGIAFMDVNGQILGATDAGALKRFEKEHIDTAEELIKSSAALLTQLEIDKELALYACEKAKKHGLLTVLNPAPADGLEISEIRNVDILTPNEPEAKLIFGLDPAKECDISVFTEMFRKIEGLKHLIITLGEKGAAVIDSGGLRTVGCPKGIKAVDTSGAGDCFNAALVLALSKGADIDRAVLFAVHAASLSVEKPEVWSSYPLLAEIAVRFGEDIIPFEAANHNKEVKL